MRPYDIAVWGASGYTGRLVCKYLAREHPELNILLAGRPSSRSALERISKGFASSVKCDVAVSDLGDENGLDSVFSQASVILSTAGPFAKIGTPIVAAAVRNECHYVDITGEPQWCREIIDTYNTVAADKHLYVVPCCGLDCVPSDIGCMMMVHHIKSSGYDPVSVRMLVDGMKGGVSGGTISSLLNMFDSCSWQQLRDLGSPFYLNPYRSLDSSSLAAPAKRAVVAAASDCFGPGRDSNLIVMDGDRAGARRSAYTMPWIMQTINTRVVNRSNAISKWRYGGDFVYSERMVVPNAISALLGSFFIALTGLLVLPLVRTLVRPLLPKPGQGPSESSLDTGFMRLQFWGKGIRQSKGAGASTSAGTDDEQKLFHGGMIALQADPGYKLTALLVSEAAICALKKRQKQHYQHEHEHEHEKSSITSGGDEIYGVVTPSTAFGPELLQALKDKGVNFFVY